MGWTTNLTLGLAEHIAQLGHGVWSPTGVFADSDTAITVKLMPDRPDRCITIAPYPIGSDDTATLVQGMQVRCRAPGMPTDVDDLADALYNDLHSVEGLVLRGVRVNHIYRRSHTPFGRDDNNRWVTSSNFYLATAHSSAHVSF